MVSWCGHGLPLVNQMIDLFEMYDIMNADAQTGKKHHPDKKIHDAFKSLVGNRRK